MEGSGTKGVLQARVDLYDERPPYRIRSPSLFRASGTVNTKNGFVRMEMRPANDNLYAASPVLCYASAELIANVTVPRAEYPFTANGVEYKHPVCDLVLYGGATILEDHQDEFAPVDVAVGPRPSPRRVHLTGRIWSPNCGFVLSVDLKTPDAVAFAARGARYAAFIAVFAALQALLAMRQHRRLNTEAAIAKVCVGTMALLYLTEPRFFFLLFLAGRVNETVFGPFALASFLKVVTFATWASLLRQTWLAFWPSRGVDPGRTFLPFIYVSMTLVLYPTVRYDHLPVFAFMDHLFWLPQIAWNIAKGTNRAFSREFMIGTTVSRLAPSAYALICPDNILRRAPHPLMFAAVALFACGQVAVLMLQDKRGARFMLPRSMRRPQHDYHRPLGPSVEEAGADCVVCMSPVDVADVQRYMLTPCNHVFHTTCLETWMAIRLECPTCRAPLPPGPTEDSSLADDA